MARDFNGSSDISYTLAASQTGHSQITVAAWVYPDSTAQYGRHFHQEGGAGFNMNMEFDDGWGWVVGHGWSTTDGKWSIAKPSTGAWVHIGHTYDWTSTTNDPIIYQNGVSQTITERVTPAGSAVNSNTGFWIGSEAGASQFFDGRIAELAIWNRILTADEMAALADGFAPSFFRRGLVFYTPLLGKLTNERDSILGTAGSVDAGVTAIAHPRIIYPTDTQSRMVPVAVSGILIKTLDGLAQASIKTYQGLASASTKTFNGLSNV